MPLAGYDAEEPKIMTKEDWIARAYLWGVGISCGVPMILAFLVFVFVPHRLITPLPFLLMMAGAFAWVMTCFGYGMHCIENAFKKPEQPDNGQES